MLSSLNFMHYCLFLFFTLCPVDRYWETEAQTQHAILGSSGSEEQQSPDLTQAPPRPGTSIFQEPLSPAVSHPHLPAVSCSPSWRCRWGFAVAADVHIPQRLISAIRRVYAKSSGGRGRGRNGQFMQPVLQLLQTLTIFRRSQEMGDAATLPGHPTQ